VNEMKDTEFKQDTGI